MYNGSVLSSCYTSLPFKVGSELLPRMGFDFASQLSLLYPGQEYEITVMTGGLVNHTIRATRIGDSNPGTGDGPD